ncbi:transient receptor potential cation channel subfamily M member-like 2 [Diadema setosum]|uniref:transient receptor potential cation channel subfamily M member-like 2 n=1 Tax=Diadema setosum TaxID=31175 RepID=UPI003B3A4F2D
MDGYPGLKHNVRPGYLDPIRRDISGLATAPTDPMSDESSIREQIQETSMTSPRSLNEGLHNGVIPPDRMSLAPGQPGTIGPAVPPSRAVSTVNLLQPNNKVGPAGIQLVKKEHAIVLRKYRKRRGSNASSVNIFTEDHVNPSWVRKNINMRECIRYTEASPSPKDKRTDDPKCQCGKRKKKHEERFLTNPDKTAKWKVETHTHTSATNAYGEIEFTGAVGGGVGQKPRKFVRVEQNTPPTKMRQMFSEVWNLSQPKLLISVTGGARNFPLNHRLKDVFRKGLIKAATSTSAWIITGGTHAGVMKYVGEAVRDHALANGRSNVVAIGIASWGVIAHREKLIDESGKFPAYYSMDAKKGILLDPNHTHFILVDNGTIDQFGVEIKLRGMLEKEISEQKLSSGPKDNAKSVSVPVVCVVVEGGPNTIQTAYEAIMNGTPAVVVAGSGRAADILAYAFQHTKEIKMQDAGGKNIMKNVMKDDDKVVVAEMIEKEFGQKDLDIHLTRIEACIQHRHLITVYELSASTSMDIDGAILHALLKANKGRMLDQLRLALIWNRVDVAKREIFTDDREWGKGQLNEALHYAIVNNQVSFVDLFMDQGVNFKEYLTVKELTLLYNEIRNNTLLFELLEKQRGKSNIKFNLEHVGKVIRDLTFDTYEPLYLRYPDLQQNIVTNQFDQPLRELFLFAILQNRHDMARLFWEEGRESIASALTASKILKAMADKEDDSDQSESMMKHAETYEDLAIGVLNECYEEDEERSALILVSELPHWGNSTCLTIAVNAMNKNFIAHSGVQNLLTEIWMGKISDETSHFHLWLCTIFPPLIYFLVKFREDEGAEERGKDKSKETNKQKDESPPDLALDDDVMAGDGDALNQSLKMVTVQQPPSENGDGANTSKVKLLDNKNGHGPQMEDDEDTFSLMNAQLDIRDSGVELAWWQRYKLFYDAPMITFRHNVMSYFVFLILYSYVIMMNFHYEISVYEIVLVVWVASLFTEEFRQIAQGESSSWKIRLYAWITDYWNLIDLATLTLFGVGFVLRFFQQFLSAARIVLSLNLIIFYIRLLHIFSVSKQLGPKLIMIQRMMVDLVLFFCILSVFLIGYGIASQAILFPNETDVNLIFRGVLMRSYFQIFGELFLEVIEGVDCSTNGTNIDGVEVNPCPEYSWMGIFLLAIYMMISNVLLLNLLIAMFSYTFSAIQDNTDIFWKFQRYDLIKEYFNRPPLTPPFIFISHFFYLIRFILQYCFHTCSHWKIPELKQSLTEQEKKTLVLWEGINSDNYTAKEKYRAQQDLNERVKLAGDRVEDMTNKLDRVFEDSDGGLGTSSTVGLLGSKGLEERLSRLEDRMERTNEALDWIIAALLDSSSKGVKATPPKLKEIRAKPGSLDLEVEVRKHEVPISIEALGIMIHQKSRASPYPGTAIRRFPVPDDKVPWETDFPRYQPVEYTHKYVLAEPHWADVDLMKHPKNARPVLMYNQNDTNCNYNRMSHMPPYQIKDGLPLNPKGRTGMQGRGLLGRFGPNHAADPIATRWKKTSEGEILQDDGKPVLEFIAIQRVDNQQWAIPGGMVEPGDKVSATLRREFSEEALGTLNKSVEEQANIRECVDKLFAEGIEVYKGYVDDPRNTDNAWMETVAMNFHDEDGAAFGSFTLEASDDAQSVRWQRVSSKIPLFASHTAMLKKVAELHNAAF